MEYYYIEFNGFTYMSEDGVCWIRADTYTTAPSSVLPELIKLYRRNVPESRDECDSETIRHYYGKGVHILKDAWKDSCSMSSYCRMLARDDNFRNACKETRNVAPRRWKRREGNSYLTDHSANKKDPHVSMIESRLERAMFLQWGRSDSQSVSECWHRIVKYQVPLKQKKVAIAGLKAIDLLAIKEDGTPVVVELKVYKEEDIAGGRKPETPVRAVLQAASYACVLQEAWSHKLRDELTEKIAKEFEIQAEQPQNLDNICIIIASNSSYWDYWRANRDFQQAKDSYYKLLVAASKYGFDVRFAVVGSDEENWLEALPSNWNTLNASKTDL